jgi:hypothetical protein
MLKKILIATILAVAVFCVVAAMQPADFRVERNATLAAPADAVFAQVNDLQKWEAWSPWAKLDPNAKTTFEGPSAGVGAIMRWDGNMEVGVGSMEITESTSAERIVMKLEFLEPFASTSTGEFAFKTEGLNTVVTWSMSGTYNFIGKAMSLIFDCEKMVGGKFEEGLTNLKALVEKK